MAIKNGIFTVSLDFELYWGLRDQTTINEYEANMKGVKIAIERILELFDKYDIHATWATVGFLFASNIEELKVLSPEKKPSYHNTKLNPYKYSLFVMAKALATAMELLIPENFPGPWFTIIFFNSLCFILFSSKNLKSSIDNLSLLFLLALIVL